MKNIIKQTVCISLLLLPSSLFAWCFTDLWQTGDQQGAKLLQAGKAEEASNMFTNKDWKAIAAYRAGNYAAAFQQFSKIKTSDGQYNAGNAAAYSRHYEEAIQSYDKAIALNPNNTDAITNRELIKKLMQEKKQSQKNSSDNTAKKTNNNTQDKDREPNNSPAENNEQKNLQEKTHSPTQEKSSPKEQADKSAATASQNQDEDKKQLLRRLAEDPGGLLRQKFRREYLRRHAAFENKEQGEA